MQRSLRRLAALVEGVAEIIVRRCVAGTTRDRRRVEANGLVLILKRRRLVVQAIRELEVHPIVIGVLPLCAVQHGELVSLVEMSQEQVEGRQRQVVDER